MLHTPQGYSQRAQQEPGGINRKPRNRDLETGQKCANSSWSPGRILASFGVMGRMDWRPGSGWAGGVKSEQGTMSAELTGWPKHWGHIQG